MKPSDVRAQPVPPPTSTQLLLYEPPVPDSVTAPPGSAPSEVMASKATYKYLSLVVLIIQNTVLVVVMRYSRTVTVDGVKYLPTTAVVMSELLKLATCVVMVWYGVQWSTPRALAQLHTEIVRNKREMFKVSVPAVLYTIQNNLLYLALTYLDAATFQVTYQLKILMTAIFSVIILHRSLSLLKWLSLVLLTVAIALVQFSNVEEPSSPEDDDDDSSVSQKVTGLLVVVCASVTSGVAGVYTEKILKGSDTSMWLRNIQLALFSLAIALVGVWANDWEAVVENGFFQGYSPVVVAAIALQALGGIVVAAVMKYADNILKGFAAALSIVLSSTVSYFLSDFSPTMSFLLGVLILLASTALYNWPQQHKSSSSSLPLYTVKPPKSL